jgi:hypothetical protein
VRLFVENASEGLALVPSPSSQSKYYWHSGPSHSRAPLALGARVGPVVEGAQNGPQL